MIIAGKKYNRFKLNGISAFPAFNKLNSSVETPAIKVFPKKLNLCNDFKRPT